MTLAPVNNLPFGAFEIFQLSNKRSAVKSALRAWSDRRSTNKALKSLSVSQMEDIGLAFNYVA